MRIQILDPETRQRLKAAERAEDDAARANGKAEDRQARNRFVPNSWDWEITSVPEPQQGIRLS